MAAVGNVTLNGTEGRTYTLNFGVNAMCRMEEIDPKQRHYEELIGELKSKKPTMSTIRLVIAAALVDPKHATLEQAGEILEDIGGALVVMDALAKSETAIESSLEREVEQQAKRPRKARVA
jgi:hypothetical protein